MTNFVDQFAKVTPEEVVFVCGNNLVFELLRKKFLCCQECYILLHIEE